MMHRIRNLLIISIMLLFTGCMTEAEFEKNAVPEGEELEIHYIDVGQADATLLKCGGESMLIDGGNAEDSSLMYTYLKEQGVNELKYLIATHAHEDHIGGLAGALNYAKAETIYCPVKNFDTEAFGNFKKYVQLQGNEIQVPAVGDTFSLGYATCEIVGINLLNDDPNNTSIIMKIQYGDTSFLFCGDAEVEAEKRILLSGKDVSCTVMKVPHHGSSSSLSYAWLAAARPEHAVISVGENNDHDHPHDTILNRLKIAGTTIYRTDEMGNIICKSDGKQVWFETEAHKVDGGELQKEKCYVLNIRSMKFHYPYCSSIEKMSEKNRMNSELTREELIKKGYESCGNCNP